MKAIQFLKSRINTIHFKAILTRLTVLKTYLINKLRQLIKKCRALDKKKKVIMITSTVMVTVATFILLCCLFLSGSKHPQQAFILGQNGVLTQRPPQNPILAKLNNIENQIQQLQAQQNSSNASPDEISQLNSSVANLRQAVSSLQATSPQDIASIKSAVASGNNNISGQLNQIKATVEQIKQQEIPRHYLPASALPWAIDGVDVRNYQPVVIRADGYGAINKGEIRDGWKLIKVQFNPPLALFQSVDHPDNYVKVQQ